MSQQMIRVWDPFVRIGHWLLVAGFFVAYFTEDGPDIVHEWSGYLVGAVVVLRIGWGFVGPEHARFSDFIFSPGEVRRYLLASLRFNAKRYIGHSPAGGAMVVLLLFGLAATVLSGMAVLAREDNRGPLASWFAANAMLEAPAVMAPAMADDEEEADENEKHEENGEEFLEEMHEFFANLTLFLVMLHIAGVTLASVGHRENLVKAMVTGNKRAKD